MPMLPSDTSHSDGLKNIGSASSIPELEGFDFSRLPDGPRNLNIERQSSWDERSLTSPLPPSIPDFIYRSAEHFDSAFSPKRSGYSGYTSPMSPFGYETHPMFADAWENLRRSLVYFRGQPVGTIAALDNSDEKLNYDQVTTPLPILC